MVVYQVYPRSFQDSDGDGVGDLPGITRRLGHIARLGCDAVWLSPIYPSPMADGGYDVADYADVDPRFGTLEDFDALVAEAHRLGLKVLLDVVPCHTSIEHPWFREHPERYVWSPDPAGPPNNWRSTFGGPAWSEDPHGRGWYLHSFYPEQPDLDWRNPDVPEAVGDVLRFWRDRGVDGFRLDAIDRLLKDPELRDDPPADGPPALPGHEDEIRFEHVHSRGAPDIADAVAALRRGAGDDAFLVGEAYVTSDRLGPYLAHLDACFAFELLHSPWELGALRHAVTAAAANGEGSAWVLSNHDFPRLPNRVGFANIRAATLLLLTLPGVAFVFQGDELGMPDGGGRGLGEAPDDRYGRDRHRHPMAWDDGLPHAGFTDGEPWLPATSAREGAVAQQTGDPWSVLELNRALIADRTALAGPLTMLDDDEAPGLLAFTRGDGDHVVALNPGDDRVELRLAGTVVRHTHDPRLAGRPVPAHLDPGEGVLLRR